MCSEYFSKDINILPWLTGIILDFLSLIVNGVPVVQIKYHSKTNQKQANKQNPDSKRM